VSAGAGGPARVRLFVALELPSSVREVLLAWRPDDRALRPVAEEALHVTLAFLGGRDAGDVERIRAALEPLGRVLGGLALGDVRWLPPRGPRVLAVDVDDPAGALAALQADVVEALVAGVGFVPEKRRFLGHVTVARVRHGARVSRELRDALGPPEPVAFAAPAVTLFRSHLSPRGARYEALVRVPLR
jgi:2'-5' RNA ligase